MTDYPSNGSMPEHVDVRSRISVVIAGHLRESVGGRDEHAAAGSLAIKPGHVAHRNLFGPGGARLLSIEVPDGLADDRGAGSLGCWRWSHGGRLAVVAIRSYLALRNAVDDAIAKEDAVLELISALSEPGDHARERHRPAWLQHVYERMHDAPSERHGLKDLAHEAGVHPVHLARVFRRHMGCTPGEYMQALRLWLMIEQMASRPTAFSDIALNAGYADQSHMTRSCRRLLGATPSRCRKWLSG